MSFPTSGHEHREDYNLIKGTSSQDFLVGHDNFIGSGFLPFTEVTGKDRIYGYGNDDILLGKSGNDSLYGGPGNDFIQGDDDNDYLSGGTGRDILLGGDGNDRIYGDSLDRHYYADHLYGNDGNDTLHGRGGNDILHGGNNDDSLYGDSYNDILYGGNGDDKLFGGNSQYGGEDNDILYGGEGNDTLTGYGGTSNPVRNDVDKLKGGPGADVFVLGDTNMKYYQDPMDWNMEAIIEDFSRSDGDSIQVHGSLSDYQFYDSGDDAIIYDAEQRFDVIAIIKNGAGAAFMPGFDLDFV